MTIDEIIRIAEEAGMPKWLQEDWFANPLDSFALKFAYLIAAEEREACATVAEAYEPRCDSCPSGVANAIRARGQG